MWDQQPILTLFRRTKEKQCKYNEKIWARSRNRCSCGKAISIIYSECVSVALLTKARKMHVLYCIVICGLHGSIIFFHIISCKERFSEKKFIAGKMRVFIFSTTLPEKFLIVRRVQRDIIIKLHASSRKLCLIVVRC